MLLVAVVGLGHPVIPPLSRPRDVSSADLVIKNQQGIKAEIEARADRFSSCIDMGQELLARSHYAAEEVGETCRESGKLHKTGPIPVISLSAHFVYLCILFACLRQGLTV